MRSTAKYWPWFFWVVVLALSFGIVSLDVTVKPKPESHAGRRLFITAAGISFTNDMNLYAKVHIDEIREDPNSMFVSNLSIRTVERYEEAIVRLPWEIMDSIRAIRRNSDLDQPSNRLFPREIDSSRHPNQVFIIDKLTIHTRYATIGIRTLKITAGSLFQFKTASFVKCGGDRLTIQLIDSPHIKTVHANRFQFRFPIGQVHLFDGQMIDWRDQPVDFSHCAVDLSNLKLIQWDENESLQVHNEKSPRWFGIQANFVR